MLDKKLDLDLLELLQVAQRNYQVPLENTSAVTQILDFIFERLRNWYSEHHVNLNAFNAVLARRPTSLTNFDQRVKAIEYFRTLPAAESLSIAHKRINNILNKVKAEETLKFDATLLQMPAEKELYLQLTQKSAIIKTLVEKAEYQKALTVLAELRPTVDTFFTDVMVMVDDQRLRDNRLALLMQLCEIFSVVADISLLYAII